MNDASFPRAARAVRVSLMVLPVACAMVAGCSGGSGSTPPKAAAGPATPTQTSSPASSPAASSPAPAGSASAAGSSGTITVEPASSAETAEFTTLAVHGCTGFTTAGSNLTEAKVTSNGWGAAYLVPKNPNSGQGATAFYRLGSTGWAFVTCGTSTFDSGIPQNVLTALNT